MEDTLEKSRLNRLITFLVLGIFAAFAVFFSLTIFAQTSLRLDEAQSLFQTNRGVGDMLYLVAQDVHVPLYHTILHYWQILFGNDIFTARMLSLVFFIGTIFGTYYLGTYAFKRRRTGLFAALIVTISPFMNWYGSEARMYTMLAFFVVLHQIFFLKLMREPKPVYWVWFTVTAILGIYTHYFFAFVLITEAIAYLLLRKSFNIKKAFLKFTVAASVVVASIIPWIAYVNSLGFASNTQPALGQPTAVDLFGTYAQFLFGFQVDAVNTIILSLWPIAVLLAFFALSRNHKTIQSEALFFVLAAVVPVLAAFIISITIRPFYLSRYLIVSLPALLIFLAWLLARYRTSIEITVKVALTAIIAVLFVIQAVNPNTPVKEDYQQAVTYLNERATASDVIVLAAPFTIYPTEYYYDGQAKLTTQPIWNRFKQGAVPSYDEATVEQETTINVASYQKAWLMLSFDQGYNDDLRKFYSDRYQLLSEKKFSPDLVVYEYKIRYDPPVTLNN